MTSKTAIISAFAAPFIAGTAAYSATLDDVHQSDYALTSEALVMIPAENQEWLDVTNTLYLEPHGFDGTPTWLQVPETYDLDASVNGAQNILIDAIESRWDAGEFSVDDPLYIFGYSQAAVVGGMVQQDLYDYGIPSDALHFILVGDSASAHGGFLNEFIDWLPEWMRQFMVEYIQLNNAGSVLGEVTPNDFYPTDVYTLTGDGWANWDDGANMAGLFTDHLAYLGLTPEEVDSATALTDGLTTYWTIDSADVDMWSALWNGFLIGISPFW